MVLKVKKAKAKAKVVSKVKRKRVVQLQDPIDEEQARKEAMEERANRPPTPEKPKDEGGDPPPEVATETIEPLQQSEPTKGKDKKHPHVEVPQCDCCKEKWKVSSEGIVTQPGCACAFHRRCRYCTHCELHHDEKCRMVARVEA